MLHWGFRDFRVTISAHEQSHENRSFCPSTQVILVQATSDFLTADLLNDLGLFQEELCLVSSLSSIFNVTFCSVVVNWVHPTKEAFIIINLLTFHTIFSSQVVSLQSPAGLAEAV